MKTKILKFGMPLMAFLLAIVFAFATEKGNPVEDDTLIPGYIKGTCVQQNVNCTPTTGGPVCRYGGKDVFQFNDVSGCHKLLYEWMR